MGKKRREQALFHYAEKEYKAITAPEETAVSFSEDYRRKREAVIGKAKRRLNPLMKRVATAALAVLLLGSGLTVHAFWDEILAFALELKDKYLTVSTEGDPPSLPEVAPGMCPVSEIPERFTLTARDAVSQMDIYAYESPEGDKLTVTQNHAAQGTNLDAESEYEVFSAAGREVFYSYKAAFRESTLYCLLDGDTSLTITGHVTREEAIQMLESALGTAKGNPEGKEEPE